MLKSYCNIETGFVDSIQRESMRRLKPGKWLNDEVINYYFVLLRKRDAELMKDAVSSGSTKRRSHFFQSFFMSKLLDTHDTRTYKYDNVKNWSQSVPGGDIFELNSIFTPINMDNIHWGCAEIAMQEKTNSVL